jgi:hypothetical protein
MNCDDPSGLGCMVNHCGSSDLSFMGCLATPNGLSNRATVKHPDFVGRPTV